MVAVVVSCKNEPKKEKIVNVKEEKYPTDLGKVFEKHGGLNHWKTQQTLSFTKGNETVTTDLSSRNIVINSPKYSLGFDGKQVWLNETEEGAYKGNPSFYYNLYFYFYSMPFVLADDGITYEKTEDLVFEGKHYPGYKISYQANVGSSSDDNYKIFYNPKTYQMEWLAYTVTFKSKKPSDAYNVIRYNDWNDVNGFLLPKSITWYKKDENGLPTIPKKTATEFTNPLINKTKMENSIYQKPIK